MSIIHRIILTDVVDSKLFLKLMPSSYEVKGSTFPGQRHGEAQRGICDGQLTNVSETFRNTEL
jgi:hypothetical protein